MLLSMVLSAGACEPELELLSWIPEEGSLPPGAFVRAETTADFPTAEAHDPDGDEVVQLEDRPGNLPEGWTVFKLPEDLREQAWDIHVFEGEELLDTVTLGVDSNAAVGSLEEELELSPQVEMIETEEPPYELCDTAFDGEWIEIVVQLELPEAPGPGWIIQLQEKGTPETWMEWPTYGGTVRPSYVVHWTLQESCSQVALIDAYGTVHQTERLDCNLLPKQDGEPGGYSQNRWGEVCGCASGLGGGGLSLALLALAAAVARRAPPGGPRRPRRGPRPR